MTDKELKFDAVEMGAKESDQGTPTVEQRPPNYARDTEMARLREAGWTYSKLGARYGLTTSGVQAALWRFARRRDKQFGLGARAFNALRMSIGADTGNYNFLTLAAIASYTFRELLEMPCLGLVSVHEIAMMLWRRGIVIEGMPTSLTERLVAGEG